MRLLPIACLLASAGVAQAGKHCHEVTRIVGRQRCGSFGDSWAPQAWQGLFVYEAALVLVNIPIAAEAQTGSVYSPTATAGYRAQITSGAGRRTWSTGLRPRWQYRGPHFVAGLELLFAWAHDPPTLTTNVDGFAPIVSTDATLFDANGVVGAHTRAGDFTLGAEAAIGLRSLVLASDLPAGFTTCVGGQTGKGCYFSVQDAHLLLELRGRADLWLGAHTTLGLSLGGDLVGHGVSIAISIAYHLAPFDNS